MLPRGNARRWSSPGWAAGLLAAVLAAQGCARVSVRALADPSADFAAYGTFDFLPDGGDREPLRNLPPRLRRLSDPLFYSYVQQAIEVELAAKGLRRVSREQRPDLLVGYHTVVKDRADAVPPIYGVGWRGRVYVAHPGHVRWYKEGTLVVDIIDARGENTVWRGIGVGALRDLRPGADLESAVEEILREFPPR